MLAGLYPKKTLAITASNFFATERCGKSNMWGKKAKCAISIEEAGDGS